MIYDLNDADRITYLEKMIRLYAAHVKHYDGGVTFLERAFPPQEANPDRLANWEWKELRRLAEVTK